VAIVRAIRPEARLSRDAMALSDPARRIQPGAFGRRAETASAGIDEALQLVASDPFGSNAWLGLRVPTAPTSTITPAGMPQYAFRYLFLCAALSVGEGARVRVTGYRQLVTLYFFEPLGGGEDPAGGLPHELEVTSPFWHFVDATYSFHLRLLGGPNAQGISRTTPAPSDLDTCKRRYSDTPALLYESLTVPAGNPYYVNLTAYAPPNGGRPWGQPLSDGHQGMIYGLRTPWRTPDAWRSLDLEVEGPATVALFCSIAQTDPATRPHSAQTAPVNTTGLCPEDQFLNQALTLGASGALWGRVAGALVYETG
jgi:hypothetical protein